MTRRRRGTWLLPRTLTTPKIEIAFFEKYCIYFIVYKNKAREGGSPK